MSAQKTLPRVTGPMSMTQLKNRLLAIDPALKIELRNQRVNGRLEGCSGFVTNASNGKVVYVSTDRDLGNLGDALYRTASDTRDFRGGPNRFADNGDLAQAVVDLLED